MAALALSLLAAPALAGVDIVQLMQLAVDTHPVVGGARAELRAAASQTDVARLQFFPAPSVQSERGPDGTATIMRLVQPLWTGGRLTADLRTGEVREQRARYSIVATQVALALKVTNSVQTYLQNQGRRLAQERAVLTLGEFGRMLDRRADAEVSARSDLNLIRARQGQAQADLETVRAAEATALVQLSQAIGRPVLPEELEIVVPAGYVSATPYALIVRAMDGNPAIRLSSLDVRLATLEVDRSRAAALPTLSLRAEYQTGQYVGSLPSGSRVYVTAQYAPGAGLAVFSQIDAAQQKVQSAEQSVEATRRDVAERVDAEWRDVLAARARLPELRSTRGASADALASNRRLFVAGRRSWIDLLNSARELTQAEWAEADAVAVSVGAYYRLALQMGIPVWTSEVVL
ncbi:TolC family protein [Variovorax saccharolyticus]|uniref:TolC family protein n=1 Tax=Variovorax saccharolyticus TaxID=3053516 RepID=UPI0025773858|nr:TolC family protein [Variovorax sp. J31P216]MDM0029877.1 TolC family protein [Variovorax sp. J31P216]